MDTSPNTPAIEWASASARGRSRQTLAAHPPAETSGLAKLHTVTLVVAMLAFAVVWIGFSRYSPISSDIAPLQKEFWKSTVMSVLLFTIGAILIESCCGDIGVAIVGRAIIAVSLFIMGTQAWRMLEIAETESRTHATQYQPTSHHDDATTRIRDQ